MTNHKILQKHMIVTRVDCQVIVADKAVFCGFHCINYVTEVSEHVWLLPSQATSCGERPAAAAPQHCFLLSDRNQDAGRSTQP